jgi:hypothetical protein
VFSFLRQCLTGPLRIPYPGGLRLMMMVVVVVMMMMMMMMCSFSAHSLYGEGLQWKLKHGRVVGRLYIEAILAFK